MRKPFEPLTFAGEETDFSSAEEMLYWCNDAIAQDKAEWKDLLNKWEKVCRANDELSQELASVKAQLVKAESVIQFCANWSGRGAPEMPHWKAHAKDYFQGDK